jgi:hypothetical protein
MTQIRAYPCFQRATNAQFELRSATALQSEAQFDAPARSVEDGLRAIRQSLQEHILSETESSELERLIGLGQGRALIQPQAAPEWNG